MKLKLAERDRLLALAEEAERSAEMEASNVAEIEAELEELLGKVAATRQALAEVGGLGSIIGQRCFNGIFFLFFIWWCEVYFLPVRLD